MENNYSIICIDCSLAPGATDAQKLNAGPFNNLLVSCYCNRSDEVKRALLQHPFLKFFTLLLVVLLLLRTNEVFNDRFGRALTTTHVKLAHEIDAHTLDLHIGSKKKHQARRKREGMLC
jgi:hypothetical protein